MTNKNYAVKTSKRLESLLRAVLVLIVSISLVACGSATGAGRQADKSTTSSTGGLLDYITERECKTGKFICPYGFGPAGKPCTCTDPSGRVWQGFTIK